MRRKFIVLSFDLIGIHAIYSERVGTQAVFPLKPRFGDAFLLASGGGRINRVLRWQLALSMLVLLVVLPLDMLAAPSALAGCLVALVPNLVFANWFNRPYRADQPERLLARMYLAQLGRFVLVGILFALSLKLLDPLEIRALFAAFVAVYMLPLLLAG